MTKDAHEHLYCCDTSEVFLNVTGSSHKLPTWTSINYLKYTKLFVPIGLSILINFIYGCKAEAELLTNIAASVPTFLLTSTLWLPSLEELLWILWDTNQKCGFKTELRFCPWNFLEFKILSLSLSSSLCAVNVLEHTQLRIFDTTANHFTGTWLAFCINKERELVYNASIFTRNLDIWFLL